MTSGNNEIWVSAYLFYPEPWEEFLVHAVFPFVTQCRQRGVIQGFFFIRYWENGPHIRLRLKCATADRHKVMHDIEEHFYRYYGKTQPAPPDSDAFGATAYSVKFIDYLPEIERYGGPAGIAIAERQFELSSDTVLAFMASKASWNYQRALGAAIQMHLSFAFACRMDVGECVAFFQYVGRASNYIDPTYGAEVNRAFEKSFHEQKSYLIPYCRNLWDTLHRNRSFAEAWMADWIAGAERIHNSYAAQPGRPKDARQGIYGSFIHMTNNRLGVLNRDEAYLAYLLVHCFMEE